jgi:lysozyme
MSVRKAGLAGGAGVIIACCAVLPGWEGTDLVAKKDVIGTGHPITYCHGQTDEFGKVKVGTRFTEAQCTDMLAKSLPPYLDRLNACIKVELPDKTKAALLDASYNAGTAAVCGTETKKPGEKGYKPMSPMVRLMNAGDIVGGCNAFEGWYIRSDGKVRTGLVARRSGSGIKGDKRKSEKELCLEGLSAPDKAVSHSSVKATITAVATAKAAAKHWWEFWK